MNIGVCQSLSSLRNMGQDTDPTTDCHELDPWHSKDKAKTGCDPHKQVRLPLCIVAADEKLMHLNRALDLAIAAKAKEHLLQTAPTGCDPPWSTRQFYDDLRGRPAA